MIRKALFTLALSTFALACTAPVDSTSNQNGDSDVNATADAESIDSVSSADSIASTSTYFSIRGDRRRCAWPMCGGYWFKKVNSQTTRCNDGSQQSECYVVDMDLENGLGLDASEASELRANANSGKVVLRGSIKTATYATRKLGFFVPTEGWLAATSSPATGTFYRVTDNGIRCFAAPCLSFHEAALNKTTNREVSDINLSPSGATSSQISDAMSLLSQEGILVAGTNSNYRISRRPGVRLDGSQFWTAVHHKAPVCKGPVATSPAPAELGGGAFIDGSSDPSATPPTYERHYDFNTSANTLEVTDYVAPCPAGAVCVWSGIVSKSATYTLLGDKIEVRYDASSSGWNLPYYKELLLEKTCDGKLQVVENYNDGTGRRREFLQK